MNLSIRDIVLAHAGRISNAIFNVHDILMNMDWDREVSDTEKFLSDLNNDAVVRITVPEPIHGHHKVKNLIDALGDRIVEIETTIGELKEGATFIEHEWILHAAMEIELLERGEKDEVTFGCGPLGMRVMALLQYEREQQSTPYTKAAFKPSNKWCNNLAKINAETTPLFAQEYVEKTFDILMEYKSVTSDSNMHVEIQTDPVTIGVGQITGLTIEYNPGQVSISGTLKIAEGDEVKDRIYFDDNGILLPQVLPQALASDLVGKKIEEVVDHDLFHGLELTIKTVTMKEDETHVEFEIPSYRPVKIKNAPLWWLIGRED